MQVQINAPHENLPDALVDLMERSVAHELAHHAERLTRVEIHVRDVNGHKGGLDTHCVIEARPRGQNPIAAEFDGTNAREAFEGAIKKLGRALTHRFGRQESH